MTPYFQDDSFTLYCGDCRTIIPQLDLSGVHLTLTDPPYGISTVDASGRQTGHTNREQVYKPVVGDDSPMDTSQIIALPMRKIVWGADHFSCGIPPGRLLVWDKQAGVINEFGFADAEIAWDSAGGACRLYKHRQVGFLNDGYGDVKRVHPNQKPLALMLWCLTCIPDDEEDYVVFDPYAGSGTTLRAAKDTGCRSIGIEIEEEYCRFIVDRMRQETIYGAIGDKRSIDKRARKKQRKDQAALDFPPPPDSGERPGDSPGGLRSPEGEQPIPGGEPPGNPTVDPRGVAVPSGGEAVGASEQRRAECPW